MGPVSRLQLYAMVAAGRFPKPINLMPHWARLSGTSAKPWGSDTIKRFLAKYPWAGRVMNLEGQRFACREPLAQDSCRVANPIDIVGHPFLSGYIRLSTISASPVDRGTSPTAAFVGHVPEWFHLRRAIRARVDLKGPRPVVWSLK